jgi:hypothetical protein
MAKDDYSRAIPEFSKIGKHRQIEPTFSFIEDPVHVANSMTRLLRSVFFSDHLLTATEYSRS